MAWSHAIYLNLKTFISLLPVNQLIVDFLCLLIASIQNLDLSPPGGGVIKQFRTPIGPFSHLRTFLGSGEFLPAIAEGSSLDSVNIWMKATSDVEGVIGALGKTTKSLKKVKFATQGWSETFFRAFVQHVPDVIHLVYTNLSIFFLVPVTRMKTR